MFNINNQYDLTGLNQFVDDHIVSPDLHEIKTFFNHNLRLINESIGNLEIQAKLLELSRKTFEIAKDARSRKLAFEIQCTAQSLVPSQNVLWSVLPLNAQLLIFQHVHKSAGTDGDKPLNQLLVSKEDSQIITTVKNKWINDNEISLKTLGCKTSNEAVKYIIDHDLTSANFRFIKNLDDEDLEKLSKSCQQLKRFSIGSLGEPIFSKDKLLDMLEKFPKLQSLSLCHCALSDSEIERIGKLANLQSLNLFGCFLNSTKPEDLGNLTNLLSLNLGNNKHLSGDQILGIVERLPNLENLNLMGNYHILGDQLIKITGKLPHLKSLNLCSNYKISGDQMVEVVKKLLNLESLNLGNNNQISGDQLLKVVEERPNLKILNLYYSIQMTANQLINIAEKLPHLKNLDLSHHYYISYEQIIEIVKMLPNLEILNLFQCGISDEELVMIANKFPNITHLNGKQV